MKTIFKIFLLFALISTYSQNFAQCLEDNCNPGIGGATFGLECVSEGMTNTLTFDWYVLAPDGTCSAPAGSWYIKVSFAETFGSYEVPASPTITNGTQFNWTYVESETALYGFSNTDMSFPSFGTISIIVEASTDQDCALDFSTVTSNITTADDVSSFPGDAFFCDQAYVDEADNSEETSSGVAALVLPVELSKFTAQKKGTTSLLSWTTSSEINNDGFEIMRSFDGLNFKKIGFVRGVGNSSLEHNYEFIDQNPNQGVNYYQLKQLDYNGNFEFSNIKQVMFESGGPIRILPNPVVDLIVFENLSHYNIQSILIMDESNKLIKEIHVDSNQNSIEYNLSDLTSGIYYAKIIGTNILHTERIIKLSF